MFLDSWGRVEPGVALGLGGLSPKPEGSVWKSWKPGSGQTRPDTCQD